MSDKLKYMTYGRKTQRFVLEGKHIRKGDDGIDVFDDYFTDSESDRDAAQKVEKHSNVKTDHKKKRLTKRSISTQNQNDSASSSNSDTECTKEKHKSRTEMESTRIQLKSKRLEEVKAFDNLKLISPIRSRIPVKVLTSVQRTRKPQTTTKTELRNETYVAPNHNLSTTLTSSNRILRNVSATNSFGDLEEQANDAKSNAITQSKEQNERRIGTSPRKSFCDLEEEAIDAESNIIRSNRQQKKKNRIETSSESATDSESELDTPTRNKTRKMSRDHNVSNSREINCKETIKNNNHLLKTPTKKVYGSKAFTSDSDSSEEDPKNQRSRTLVLQNAPDDVNIKVFSPTPSQKTTEKNKCKVPVSLKKSLSSETQNTHSNTTMPILRLRSCASVDHSSKHKTTMKDMHEESGTVTEHEVNAPNSHIVRKNNSSTLLPPKLKKMQTNKEKSHQDEEMQVDIESKDDSDSSRRFLGKNVKKKFLRKLKLAEGAASADDGSLNPALQLKTVSNKTTKTHKKSPVKNKSQSFNKEKEIHSINLNKSLRECSKVLNSPKKKVLQYSTEKEGFTPWLVYCHEEVAEDETFDKNKIRNKNSKLSSNALLLEAVENENPATVSSAVGTRDKISKTEKSSKKIKNSNRRIQESVSSMVISSNELLSDEVANRNISRDQTDRSILRKNSRVAMNDDSCVDSTDIPKHQARLKRNLSAQKTSSELQILKLTSSNDSLNHNVVNRHVTGLLLSKKDISTANDKKNLSSLKPNKSNNENPYSPVPSPAKKSKTTKVSENSRKSKKYHTKSVIKLNEQQSKSRIKGGASSTEYSIDREMEVRHVDTNVIVLNKSQNENRSQSRNSPCKTAYDSVDEFSDRNMSNREVSLSSKKDGRIANKSKRSPVKKRLPKATAKSMKNRNTDSKGSTQMSKTTTALSNKTNFSVEEQSTPAPRPTVKSKTGNVKKISNKKGSSIKFKEKISNLNNQSPVKNIVPHKKGSKKKDRTKMQLEIQESTEANDSLRRSKRHRVPPLEIWRNERMRYRYNINGEISFVDIVKGSKNNLLSLGSLKPAKIHKTKNNTKPPATPEPKLFPVFDTSSGEIVHANVFKGTASLDWINPQGTNETADYLLTRIFHGREQSFGFLKIRPTKRKPSQQLPHSDAYFLVIQGQVKVKINTSVFLAEPKDSFIVPRGNPYSVDNVLSRDAILSFTIFSGSILHELTV